MGEPRTKVTFGEFWRSVRHRKKRYTHVASAIIESEVFRLPALTTVERIALYLHFPFCVERCRYCSFVSHEGREKDIPAYINTIKRELAERAHGQRVSSIYFGGGTPSLLPAGHLADILSTIRSCFTMDESAEVTIEANPGTFDGEYLKAIRALGINRLSIGVQSLDDGVLSLLGRIHNAAQAKESVPIARKAGFSNLNLDLIYGIPRQSIAVWRETLHDTIELGPDHISLYSLTLESDVPMHRMIARGDVAAPDSDLAADQYELAENLLPTHGYRHYEISNWAREGVESRHNLAYWQTEPYLGIGAAAHSFIDGRRMANTANLDEYLNACLQDIPLPPAFDEIIDPETALSEAIIMGLRLCKGIDPSEIRDRFGIDLAERYGGEIRELVDLGLIEREDHILRLTRRGRLLGNEVFWRFLPHDHELAGALHASPVPLESPSYPPFSKGDWE